MKHVKERNFIKKIFDENMIEITKSQLTILEASYTGGKLSSVTFKDRFKECYNVYYKQGKGTIDKIN